MISPLDDRQRAVGLSLLPEWTYDAQRRALYRQLRLGTFSRALGLMVQVGLEAEKMDHHPEWTNVYGRLDIWLTTHDAGGVSQRDLALAEAIDALVFAG